jgi:hypothetical protein
MFDTSPSLLTAAIPPSCLAQAKDITANICFNTPWGEGDRGSTLETDVEGVNHGHHYKVFTVRSPADNVWSIWQVLAKEGQGTADMLKWRP